MAFAAHNDTFCTAIHRLVNKVDGGTDSNSTANGGGTWQHDVAAPSGTSAGSDSLTIFKFYLASVVNPALCVFGVIGNVFNVIVLSRGQIKATLECSMELAAHTGLVALAVSDIMYCVSAFMNAVVSRHVTMN